MPATGCSNGWPGTLEDAVRPGDLVARFGGDEFTVLCEVTSEADASEIGHRLEASVDHPTDASTDDPFVSLSIGMAVSDPRAADDPSLLIRRADAAMYQAKSGGKGRVVVFHPGDRLHSERRLQRSDELRLALGRGEMELFYQPIVELATGAMVGLEAQPRWRHPGGELLAPESFMPIAEESGLAVQLGNWALAEVCRRGAAWNKARAVHGQLGDRLNLTINVSSQQMADPGFAEDLPAILHDTGFPPGQLWLEITEGTVLEHRELVRDTAEHIRDLGVHIGIDAFGSEYASFYYLKELRTELAKLDLQRIGHADPEVREGLLRGMLALADALGILCVATGVDTAGQAELLRSLGYRLAEGSLFGRPLSTHQIGAFPTDDLLAWETAVELTAV